MKSGMDIEELARKLKDVKQNKHDYIVPTSEMSVGLEKIVDPTQQQLADEIEVEPKPQITPVVQFKNGDVQSFALNKWSDQQLATYTDVPYGYYRRIKSQNPALFADSINHGLHMKVVEAPADKPETRMIRTYRGSIRALLSSRYRCLDCFDLFDAVCPTLVEHGFIVESSELTLTRMYIQAVTPRVQAEVAVGDIVQFGLVVSSSDVGAGSVRIEPLLKRLACINGMIMTTAIKKMHIGRSLADDNVYELLTDGTKELTDAAFWSQVRDVVNASMKKEVFMNHVDRLRVAANQKISNFDLPRVIELTARQIGVTNEGVKQSMLEYLSSGADGAGLTKWGLANSVTHAAQSDAISYDDAIDLERAGSQIIDLTPRQWSAIAAKPA